MRKPKRPAGEPPTTKDTKHTKSESEESGSHLIPSSSLSSFPSVESVCIGVHPWLKSCGCRFLRCAAMAQIVRKLRRNLRTPPAYLTHLTHLTYLTPAVAALPRYALCASAVSLNYRFVSGTVVLYRLWVSCSRDG